MAKPYICGALHEVGSTPATSVLTCGGVQSRQIQTFPDIKGVSRPSQKDCRMEQTVEAGAFSDFIPASNSVRHLPYPSQLEQVGSKGGPTVQVVWRYRNHGAHSFRVQDNINPGKILLVA